AGPRLWRIKWAVDEIFAEMKISPAIFTLKKVQASHLNGQTQIWAKPKPLFQTERANTQEEILVCLLSFL
ncbi:MAG: hypothetical protein IKD31_05920, partial [Clostridia bacterium]|nr:hypothetical protein [Clostridia bacterium]